MVNGAPVFKVTYYKSEYRRTTVTIKVSVEFDTNSAQPQLEIFERGYHRPCEYSSYSLHEMLNSVKPGVNCLISYSEELLGKDTNVQKFIKQLDELFESKYTEAMQILLDEELLKLIGMAARIGYPLSQIVKMVNDQVIQSVLDS